MGGRYRGGDCGAGVTTAQIVPAEDELVVAAEVVTAEITYVTTNLSATCTCNDLSAAKTRRGEGE